RLQPGRPGRGHLRRRHRAGGRRRLARVSGRRPGRRGHGRRRLPAHRGSPPGHRLAYHHRHRRHAAAGHRAGNDGRGHTAGRMAGTAGGGCGTRSRRRGRPAGRPAGRPPAGRVRPHRRDDHRPDADFDQRGRVHPDGPHRPNLGRSVGHFPLSGHDDRGHRGVHRFRDARGAPVQHAGLQRRRLPLHRLRQSRAAADAAHPGRVAGASALDLALLAAAAHLAWPFWRPPPSRGRGQEFPARSRTKMVMVTNLAEGVTARMSQAPAPQTVRKRSEIPEQYRWRLEDIFATNADWEKEFAAVKEAIPQIGAFAGKLGESPATLARCLDLMFDTVERFERVIVYAFTRRDEDTTNPTYQELYDRAQRLAVELTTATSFVEPEILQLSQEQLDEYLSSQELSLYRHYLDNIVRNKPHTLSPQEEAILAAAGEMAQAPNNVFGMFNNADLKFPFIKDENGQEVEVTHGRYIRLMESKDRRV